MSARRGRLAIPVLVAVFAIAPFIPNLCRPSGITASRHSDLIAQDVPWRHFMAEVREEEGSLPRWNPMLLGGLPTLENLAIPGFYPPFTPLVLTKAQWGYTLLYTLHTAWMALGVFFLGRRLGAGRRAAGIAGLAFATGARMMGHAYAGHLVQTAEVSWLPWILLLADRLPTALRAAFPVSLLLGFALLCGHPQVPLFTILVAGVWVLGQALSGETDRVRRTALAGAAYAGAVAGALVVAAAQLLPSFLFSQETGRAGGVDLVFASSYALGRPLSLIGLVLPLPLGHPEIGTYWGPPNYWELCAYLGIPVLVLAALGWRGERGLRPRWLLLGLLAGTILFATGSRTPLFPALFHAVLGLDHFRAPARTMILASLFAALLATRGIDLLIQAPRARDGVLGRRVLPVLAGLAVLAAAVWALAGDPIREAAHEYVRDRYHADPGAPGHSKPIEYWLDVADGAYRTMRTSLIAAAALLAATVGIVRLRARERIGGVVFAALLAVVVLAEGFFVGGRFLSWQKLPETTPVPDVLAGLEQSGGRFRVLDQTGVLSNGVSMSARIEQVGGYDATIPRRYMDYVAGMDDLEREPLGTTISAERKPITAEWRRWWLDWLNTRYVISKEDLRDQGFRLVRKGEWAEKDAFLFENPTARPRATLHGTWKTAGSLEEARRHLRQAGETPVLVVEGVEQPEPGATSGTAEITEYGPDRVAIRTTSEGPSMLLLADSWSAGWKAMVDGERATVHPANMALRAVAVPAGEHVVEMWYEPRGYPAGLGISVLGTALLLAAWFVTARAERGDAGGGRRTSGVSGVPHVSSRRNW